MSENDERLVAAIRAGLARLANGAANSRRQAGDQSRAIVAALDGAEAVMRGEILCGQIDRLPDLVSDSVFLVTLPVVGRKEALRLAAHTRELLNNEEQT